MKKVLLKFADALMSNEQMKGIKGGVVYCNCPDREGGPWIGFPDTPLETNWDCNYRCANG